MKKLLLPLLALTLVVGCGSAEKKNSDEEKTSGNAVEGNTSETVVEEKAPVLTLTTSNDVEVDAYGCCEIIGYTLENPKSDVELIVDANADWIWASVSDGIISYDVNPNMGSNPRVATITVTYGTERFDVNVTQSTIYHNGHMFVDLGLSVKWATCNVGASQPSDYGYYYSWGDTSTQSNYKYGKCSTWEKSIDDIACTDRDAALVNWGGDWRMPTKAEFDELLSQCIWTWTTQNGRSGYIVTSKTNGNNIFLPAAGNRLGSRCNYEDLYGMYWCSTPDSEDTRSAYELSFDPNSQYMQSFDRYFGLSVRPVIE